MAEGWSERVRARASGINPGDNHTHNPISYDLASTSSETWAVLLKATDGACNCEAPVVFLQSGKDDGVYIGRRDSAVLHISPMV